MWTSYLTEDFAAQYQARLQAAEAERFSREVERANRASQTGLWPSLRPAGLRRLALTLRPG